MNRIKELRNTAGINQEQLALVLNVKRAAVSKYENGDIPLTAETIKLLSDYFNVTTDYLLGRTETPETNKSAPDEAHDVSDIEFAFLRDVRELTDDDRATLADYAAKMRELAEFKKKQKDGV